MKKILSYFGLSTILGMLLFSNAWTEEPKNVVIELFVVEPSPNVLQELVYPNFFKPPQGIPQKVDADKFVQYIKFLIEKEKVFLLQNPRINALMGEEASFKTGGDILYMEKIGYDTFKLKRLTGHQEGQGLFVKITPRLTKDGKVSVEYKLLMREVTSRMRIYGAEELNFGMPLINCRESTGSITLEDGKSQIESGLIGKLAFYHTIFGVRKGSEIPEITIVVFILQTPQAPKTIPSFELI